MLAWLLGCKVDADVKPPTTNRNVQYSLLDVRGWLGLPGSHDVERTKAERPLCASVVRGRPPRPTVVAAISTAFRLRRRSPVPREYGCSAERSDRRVEI